MERVLGLINLQHRSESLKELSNFRTLPAVPFGGKYRLVDFVLSNMVNSGINQVGLLLPARARSILDHIRSGKAWDLARKRGGLVYLPHEQNEDAEQDLPIYYDNLEFVNYSNAEHILVASGNVVYNMDYENVLRLHRTMNADFTLICYIAAEDQNCMSTVVKTDENGRITDIAVLTKAKQGDKLLLGAFLARKGLFIEVVQYAIARGGTDFIRDVLIKNFDKYTVYTYTHRGFTARISSLANYYKANMDLLKIENWQELFFNPAPIRTKVKDEAPSKYKQDARVTNSLIANGCVIEGTVENSVIFRNVSIGKNVHVKNSIIMQKCIIGNGSSVENIICDKNVTISIGSMLKGAGSYPLIIEKNIII